MQALTQSGIGLLASERDKQIRASSTTNWEGKVVVEYSKLIPLIAKDKQRRLAYAFKRSFRAILATSSTTAVAFLSNTLSDIRPIRAFGIFAAILIPVNFLIIILVLPSIQIVYETHLKNQCSCKRICKCCFKKQSAEVAAEPAEAPEKDCLSRFFGTYFNMAVFKLRIPIIVLFWIFGIACGVVASGIGPLTKPEEFLPADSELMMLLSDVEENFPSA
mgnify:CR=1 FL=1